MKKCKLSKKRGDSIAHTPDEIGEFLGLSKGDIGLMKYRAELAEIATA